jgi:hypothetical protein
MRRCADAHDTESALDTWCSWRLGRTGCADAQMRMTPRVHWTHGVPGALGSLDALITRITLITLITRCAGMRRTTVQLTDTWRSRCYRLQTSYPGLHCSSRSSTKPASCQRSLLSLQSARSTGARCQCSLLSLQFARSTGARCQCSLLSLQFARSTGACCQRSLRWYYVRIWQCVTW